MADWENELADLKASSASQGFKQNIPHGIGWLESILGNRSFTGSHLDIHKNY